MINLFFLKTFITVAQTGSFRVAAEKNNITQPAVTQHIRILERTLHCVLFERTSRKIILTADGQIFMSYAQQILELYEESRNKILENKNQCTGTIHIYSVYTMGLYQLKPIMQKLLSKNPGININLEYAHRDAIYEAIKLGKADFGLVAYPKPMPGCTSKVFTQEELILVQSHKHRIFKKKTIEKKDLEGKNFVGFDASTTTGEDIQHYFASQNIRLNIIKEYQNIETIKNSIDIGLGFSILPKSTVLQEIKNKTFDVITVKDFYNNTATTEIYTNKKTFSKSARLFLNLLLKEN